MVSIPTDLKKVTIEEAGSFDISEIEGKEIWILRAPSKLDRSVLKDLDFKTLFSSHQGISHMQNKNGLSYDLVDASGSASSGGLEMQTLNVILPDEFGTQDYSFAPNVEKRMFMIKDHVEIPNVAEAGAKVKERTKRKPRRQLGNMKQMFKPYGSENNSAESKDDKESNTTPQQKKKQKTSSGKSKEKAEPAATVAAESQTPTNVSSSAATPIATPIANSSSKSSAKGSKEKSKRKKRSQA